MLPNRKPYCEALPADLASRGMWLAEFSPSAVLEYIRPGTNTFDILYIKCILVRADVSSGWLGEVLQHSGIPKLLCPVFIQRAMS